MGDCVVEGEGLRGGLVGGGFVGGGDGGRVNDDKSGGGGGGGLEERPEAERFTRLPMRELFLLLHNTHFLFLLLS